MSLQLYKPLTSNDPNVRLKAASELTSQLLALVESDANIDDIKTQESGAENTTTSTETQPVRSKSAGQKEEIHYALNRLIRGLASGHESARFGFAVVLTEYLSTLLRFENRTKWAVNVEMVLGLVHKHMAITDQLTRLEERDRWLGRLFGLKAIIMSGCLFQSEESGGVSEEREFRTVMGEILDLGREKSWLREPGMWAVVAAARKFAWNRSYVGLVWKMVVERDLAKTSEGVGVWLCFEELCPGAAGEVELELGKVWGEGRWGPLMAGNLAALAKVLKESGAAGSGAGGEGKDDAGNKEQKGKKGGKGSGIGGKGVWNPKLHWVWDEIIRVYLAQQSASSSSIEETESGKKKDKGKKDRKSKEQNTSSSSAEDALPPFSQFFLIVVDESLFSASSSEERKFHGFLLLIKLFNLLGSVPQYIPYLLPYLFTRNLLRCIINHLSDQSRYLHKSAAKTISTIQQLAVAQPETIPFILKGLVLGNGTTAFDQLTKTKTVEKLLPLGGESGDVLREVVGVFRDIIISPPIAKTGADNGGVDTGEEGGNDDDDDRGDQKPVKREEDSKRQWAADQLLSLVRSGKGRKHDLWTGDVVELFAALGHFDISASEQGDAAQVVIRRITGGQIPAPKISDASRDMFRARLASVLGHLLTLRKRNADNGVDVGADKDTWPYRAVKVVREIMSAGGTLTMEFDEAIDQAVSSGWEKLEAIRAKRDKLASTAKPSSSNSIYKEIPQLQAFELLYSLVLLQTYNGDSDAVELLEELKICYGKIMKDTTLTSPEVGGKKKKAQGKEKSSTLSTTSSVEDGVDASAILVDLILSFLAKPSVLLRKIARSVWASFVGTSAVGKPALDALLDVLETKESFVGQQELFDRNDDADEEDDDDDLEMDSDVEEITPKDAEGDGMDIDEEYKGVQPRVSTVGRNTKGEDEDEEEGDSDTEMSVASPSDESDEEADLPTDDETLKFEAALGKALKTKKVLPGQEPQDEEEDSDSDADMTDSEMMGLDKHLSIIFRERLKKLRAPQSKKKERADARENVLVFKAKVLELLEEYVKGRFTVGKDSQSHVHGDSGLFLTSVVPRLLCVMRITGKPQLREKISAVIRLFVRESSKGTNTTTPTTASTTDSLEDPTTITSTDSLWKTLETIHEEVLKEGGGAGHTAACSTASISVVKSLLKSTPGEDNAVSKITSIYAVTMTKWLISGGVGVNSGASGAGSTLQIQSFFTDFVGWGGSVRKVSALGLAGKNRKGEESQVEGADGVGDGDEGGDVTGANKQKQGNKKDKSGGKKQKGKDVETIDKKKKKVKSNEENKQTKSEPTQINESTTTSLKKKTKDSEKQHDRKDKDKKEKEKEKDKKKDKNEKEKEKEKEKKKHKKEKEKDQVKEKEEDKKDKKKDKEGKKESGKTGPGGAGTKRDLVVVPTKTMTPDTAIDEAKAVKKVKKNRG